MARWATAAAMAGAAAVFLVGFGRRIFEIDHAGLPLQSAADERV